MITPLAQRFVLAADIGGTSMRAAVVDLQGVVSARVSIATEPKRGIDDASQRLVSVLRRVAQGAPAGARIEGIGIATAGPIDPASGAYRHPPNLPGWHGQSMRPAVSEALSLPVTVGHDATLAALAEAHFGAHRGTRDLVYLTVSTGIGAGIVANGMSVTGSAGGAGEAGHMIVQPGGPRCNAGCSGCLEAVASGSGIANAARDAIAHGAATILGPEADAADVFAAAALGDPLAMRIVDDAIGGLAVGLTNLLALLDPDVVVLGGGVAQSLKAHWAQLLARTLAMGLPRYAGGVPIELTTLGDDASLLGAALIAFEAASR